MSGCDEDARQGAVVIELPCTEKQIGKMGAGERWGMQPPPETGEEIPGDDAASRGVAPHKKLRRKQET